MSTSLQALIEQKAELERRIAEMQREERAAAIEQIKSLMAQYGLTLADLGPRAAAAPRGAGPGPGSGAKVAPKYRDPATGATWSGRGLQPKWLKAALDAGRSLSDFAI